EPEVRAINHARAGMDVLAALRAEPAATSAPAKAPAKAPVVAKEPASKRRRRAAEVAPPAAVAATVAAPVVVAPVAAPPVPEPAPAAAAPPATAKRARPEAPVAPSTRNTHVDFRTRHTAQRLAGALLLVTVPATAAIGWFAYYQRDPTYAGATLILASLTLGPW